MGDDLDAEAIRKPARYDGQEARDRSIAAGFAERPRIGSSIVRRLARSGRATPVCPFSATQITPAGFDCVEADHRVCAPPLRSRHARHRSSPELKKTIVSVPIAAAGKMGRSSSGDPRGRRRYFGRATWTDQEIAQIVHRRPVAGKKGILVGMTSRDRPGAPSASERPPNARRWCSSRAAVSTRNAGQSRPCFRLRGTGDLESRLLIVGIRQTRKQLLQPNPRVSGR